jgi:hypothetical protein
LPSNPTRRDLCLLHLMCPFRATSRASDFLPAELVPLVDLFYIHHTLINPWHRTLIPPQHRAIDITHR